MDAANNEKIEVGLESERGSQTLGQVVSVLEPKWQQSRIEFTSSSAQEYKVSYEIKGLCGDMIFCRFGSD